MTLRIAIVVQGRFHAFDMARTLLARGHKVTVFTNYPVRVAARFGLPATAVRSYVGHFVAERSMQKVSNPALARLWEPFSHRAFGRWAARQLAREPWDVIHCWSGVSEEILRSPAGQSALTLLMRGSSHVRVQRQLMDEESARVSSVTDSPSDWMIARELREYALADRIVVLSSFSARTFIDEGVPAERVCVLPLGVDVRSFRATEAMVERRLKRIRSGEPLTVLYVGSISYRKGFWDLAKVIQTVSPEHFRFKLVGKIFPECQSLVSDLGPRVEAHGPVPQAHLPDVYAEGDVFVFPTIEDGFPQVLTQAQAAGLPILSTPNCSASDLVKENENGWILPIRSPHAFVDRLHGCDRDRERLASMARTIPLTYQAADWTQVATDFEQLCVDAGASKRSLRATSQLA